jgi:AbiV family abortive infection protein
MAKVEPQPLPSHLRAIQVACHEHADDLLRSADRVLNQENLPHIAYHLSALALEEIGKAELIGIGHMAAVKGEERSSKQLEDHVKKLFWALWGPSFGQELITKEQIETFQGLATNIHETRLRGLYVATDGENFFPPKEAVPKAAADNLLSLTKARLGLARTQPSRDELSPEAKTLVSWFLAASSDSEKRNMIFSKKSMEKLVELGGMDKWMQWLRDQFEKADADAKAALEAEMKRQRPGEAEAEKDKWRIKVRFFTNSHSIRPKTLTWWNNGINWVKLHAVDKRKDELLVEFILPMAVPMNGLWWAGWGGARRFACSINIGSMGFFWWYVPDQISRFYDSIHDLEHNVGVQVERTPRLRLDWNKDALTEQDLRNASLAYAMLPAPQDRQLHGPFDAYLTGLGFLSKTDIHMQFEANAYEAFFDSLMSGMKQYGEWDGTAAFEPAFNRLLDGVLPTMAADERERYFKMGMQFKLGKPTMPISLSEVGAMKILCDAFYVRTFRRLAEERSKREGTEVAGAPGEASG